MKKWIMFLTIPIAVLASIYSWQVIVYNMKAPVAEATVKPKVLSKYETGKPDAQEMLELVNAERKKVGVAPLKMHPSLLKSAQYKADDFVKYNYYEHVSPHDGKHGYQYVYQYSGSLCKSAGENISADEYTAKDTVEGWMASPPHRKAILEPQYTYTGFGVSQEKDGDYYAVEHFCIAK